MSFSLKNHNTFGLDVRAAHGYVIGDFAMFAPALEKIAGSGLPFLVLGRGSDVLFTEDFGGVALINALKGFEFNEDRDFHYVKIQAGEDFDEAIRTCLARGIRGLENLALIPGTAGAAPVQNIGAYGASFADFCRYVEVLDLATGRLDRIGAADCGFGYRTSIFKKRENAARYIITAVELKIPKAWTPNLGYESLAGLEGAEAWDIYRHIAALRRDRLPDPRELGNAGSFFKNPVVDAAVYDMLLGTYPSVPAYPAGEDGKVKLAAGWLIDRAGCRGMRVGNAGTSAKQALVVVNYGGAAPAEIVLVAQLVRGKVFAKFGVLLEPEVRIYGRTGECGL